MKVSCVLKYLYENDPDPHVSLNRVSLIPMFCDLHEVLRVDLGIFYWSNMYAIVLYLFAICHKNVIIYKYMSLLKSLLIKMILSVILT